MLFICSLLVDGMGVRSKLGANDAIFNETLNPIAYSLDTT